MKVAGVIAALAVALVLQTTLAGLSMRSAGLVNLVLIAVVYVALAQGAVTGLLAGAAGGIVQDALAGAVIGVGGLTKTIVGFFVGVLGAQFIVSQPLPRFVMFVAATVVHELCFQALSAVVESRGFSLHYSTLVTQALINGAIGLLAFQVIEGAPGLVQRRQMRRSSDLSRRRF
ncbi:MAG TPA: rod shape-determining protein MreD [Vicinamibacterales bacterium]